MDSQYIDPYLNLLHILILSFSSESRTQLDVLTCRIAHAYHCWAICDCSNTSLNEALLTLFSKLSFHVKIEFQLLTETSTVMSDSSSLQRMSYPRLFKDKSDTGSQQIEIPPWESFEVKTEFQPSIKISIKCPKMSDKSCPLCMSNQ